MINEELSNKFGYDFPILNSYIQNWKPVKELEWVANNPNGRFIRKLTDSEREYFDLGWYELKKAKPELELTYQDFVDNKIIFDKQPRKLFKYLNDKDLSELVGKYKLPKTDLYLVISTNFDDFLMCSTKNNWTACTDLRNGDFKYTSLGNIFTDGRFIVYITDMKEKEFEGLNSYNMFFRCFGFVNEDGELITNIWYPIKEYMSVDFLGVKSVKEVLNKKSKYGVHKIFNKFDTFVYPYLDYSVFDGETFMFKDEYLKFEPIVEFMDGTRKYLGDYLKFGEGLDFENSLWSYCDRCGSKKGVRTYGELNLCDECVQKEMVACANCAMKEPMNFLNFTEDNEWICNNCKQPVFKRTDVKTCSCGTLIRMKGKEQCKYCRSDKEDAFKNIKYSYLNNGNRYDYFWHHYIEDGKLPPYIYEDEEIFEETEMYSKRPSKK